MRHLKTLFNIFILAINFLFFYCIDFCIARPIRFVVGLALNTYDDDDDGEENKVIQNENDKNEQGS